MLDEFKFHHIGIAVKDINTTAMIYVKGGYIQSKIIFDPIQNVNICWLQKEGMPLVELLEPVDESSPVNKTLEKNGVCPYHTCYIVENIENAIAQLRSMKYIVVSKPEQAIAISNCKVCFLYNKNVGLIELVETPANILM